MRLPHGLILECRVHFARIRGVGQHALNLGQYADIIKLHRLITVGCGVRPQIVSSCLGVSEQYCNIYKKTLDKHCKLLKYNLPALRASD